MTTPTPPGGWHDSGDEKTVHIPPRGAAPGPRPNPWQPPQPPQAHSAPGYPTNWVQPPALPPGGYGPPPGWAPAPAPGGKGRRTLWLSIAAAVVLVTVLVGTFVFANRGGDSQRTSSAADQPTDTTTAPAETATPVAPIPVAALTGLLLSPPEAASVAGSATMVGNGDYGDKIYEAMSDEPIVDEACMSLSPGLEGSYKGSGFTASRQQFLKGESADRKVVQTVVSFSDAASAQRYVTSTTAKWKACANRTINLGAVAADANYWGVGEITESDGLTTATRVEEGGGGWGCRNGLSARNNVVIDFTICGEDVPASVVPAFADKVSAKIAGNHK